MTNKDTVSFKIYVTAGQRKILKKAAANEQRSLSNFGIHCILAGLSEEERTLFFKLAQ